MRSRFAAGEACSQMARSICEPLDGTAPQVDVWLLLEYGLPWTAEILKANALSPEVNQWLRKQLKTLPLARLQFIKQGRRRKAPHRFYIVAAHPLRPRMYAFSLNSYEELIRLDIEAILADAPEMRPHLTDAPLFAVCTNSRRDPCCAKYGFPIYQQMAAAAPEAVWQCSHVGGDRFAANVLCFPHGLCYGRVDAGGADQILADYRANGVTWEYLRGRSCYEPVAQAAERMIREQVGVRALNGLELVDTKQEETGHRVTFRVLPEDTAHTVHIIGEQMPQPRYKNCRATEMTSAFCFRKQEAFELPR